jgi:RNA polymerase sigma-B factor
MSGVKGWMSGVTAKRAGLARRANAGDREARDALVIELLPLARRLARRYARSNESLDDLEQVAAMGVVKAVDRFDPDRGATLTRYATTYIEGELRHHLRDNLGVPHVPRTMRSTAGRAGRAANRLAAELGREPRVEELAARVEMKHVEIREALEVAAALRPPRSLDEAAGGEPNSPAEGLGDTDWRLEQVEDRQLLARILGALPRSDRSLMFLRVVADVPPQDVAKRMGVSSRHAARLLGRALARAREAAGRNDPEGDRQQNGHT